MPKGASILHKNKGRICKNIKAIRCYLQLSKTEFADKAGFDDYKRGIEIENGRYRPNMQEIEKIAKLAEVNPQHIIHNVFYLTLSVA